jgi:hypothetical protein
VIPDVVWISKARLAVSLDEAGHLTSAPELIVEVLSPGTANEQRDRQAKLKLYAFRGVQDTGFWTGSCSSWKSIGAPGSPQVGCDFVCDRRTEFPATPRLRVFGVSIVPVGLLTVSSVA